ncbi:MAG: alpha/beta hydrolase [Ilumatobacteraceae bacterium]
MPFVAANGIDIHYERHGSGPPLLNISGSGNDLRRSPAAVVPVNRAFDTLHYDQRGLGQTSKPAADYTMADYADDAAALVAAMGWERCRVLGTSFGGMVALELAVRHPEVIERLVLCCTSAGGASASYPLHELDELDADEAFATRMRITDRRWDPDADEPMPGLGRFYDQMVAGATASPSPETLAGMRRQLLARSGHDVVDALGAIECPTLVCAGAHDDIAPLANSEFIAERIPGARLEVFDGGHIFLVQDRSAFPAIISFLEESS